MPHRKTSPPTVGDAPVLLCCSVDWLVWLRVPVLLLCMVTAALAFGPSLGLDFDRSVEGLFHESDPRLVNYLEDKELFGGAETGLVAYTDPKLLTSAGLKRLEGFDSKLRDLPGVEEVLSLTNVKLPSAPMSPLSLRGHLDAGKLSSGELRTELLGCDIYRGRLLADDGQTTVLLVSLAPSGQGSVSRRETIKQIRVMCDAHNPPAVLAGGPVLVEDVYRHLEEDSRTLGIASSLVLAVVIGILFRNLRWLLLPLAVVHLTLVWTKGLLVVSGMKLSMVSSPLVALVTVIGVTTLIHVTIRFREERTNHTPPHALQRTLVHIGPAIFWTCLTTAVGFSSLLASRIAPVGDFGSMMALGSALVFMATVGLVPAGVLVGRYRSDPARAPGEKIVAVALGRIVAAVERYPWRVAAFGLGLLGITSLGILRLQVATDFDENFRKTSRIVQSHRFIADRMGTTAMFDVLIDTPDLAQKEEFDNFLEQLRGLQSDLTGKSGVAGTLSVVNILDFMLGTPKEEKKEDFLSQLATGWLKVLTPAQRLEALRTVQPELVSGFWNHEHNVVRIVVQTKEIKGTKAKQQLIESIEADVRGVFPSARTAGVDILLTYLVKSMLTDQWITFSLAIVAILMMLMIAFRDWRLGLLALVPNAAPIVIVVGAMGWLGLKVNVATAMLASVSMGLSVDFSIHYLYRFQHELRAGKSFGAAMRDAHGSVGLAMVLANVALIAGFSTLMMSSFVPTVHFGILVSFATMGGLVGNLTALPLLLRLLPGFGVRRIEADRQIRTN